MPPEVIDNTPVLGDSDSENNDANEEADNPASRISEALAYLRVVRRQYNDTNQRVYHGFLDIMAEFRRQRIDERTVVNRVVELFYDNTGLVLGLNSMLPNHLRLSMESNHYILTCHGVRHTYPPLEELARQNQADRLVNN